jgi:hypothetical protein
VLKSLTRHCDAGSRFGDIDSLWKETHGWSFDINCQRRGVEQHMKIDDARVKQTSVYAKIKM